MVSIGHMPLLYTYYYMSHPKVLAFYLPQYHPFKENDEWWGKGFTEWTNVAKAKPLFYGHYQPKVPSELGFYDLRLTDVQKAQAELARQYGVDGFCYYNYWFSGTELMGLPLHNMVRDKSVDIPFCICWANETWYNKMWSKDGSIVSKKVLIEQAYPGQEDNERHFYSLLDAFKDDRYIKVDGRLLFMIYKPLEMSCLKEFMDQWNILAEKEGLPHFYFVGQTIRNTEFEVLRKSGLDCVCYFGLWDALALQSRLGKWADRLLHSISATPRRFRYPKLLDMMPVDVWKDEFICPSLLPNWDHTPRSGLNGFVLTDTTPEVFEGHVRSVFNLTRDKRNRLVFLKSWNEWGEGNYVEPDLRFGRGYLEALKRVKDNCV